MLFRSDGDFDYINEGRGANVIHVVSKDGQLMGEKQVVLRNSDYPAFCSCHVRDPKVWKQGEYWYMVLGARTKNSEGGVLIYRSNTLTTWEYVSYVTKENFGYMWECPDYFCVEGKGILSISPQGLKKEQERYQNVYQSGWFSCDWKDMEIGRAHV